MECAYSMTIACALRLGVALVAFHSTGHCSLSHGTPFSGTRNVQGDGAHYRSIMRRKPDCGFDLYFVKHVLEFLILIYFLYKSGVNLNSYVWSYSHVLVCLSMGK